MSPVYALPYKKYIFGTERNKGSADGNGMFLTCVIKLCLYIKQLMFNFVKHKQLISALHSFFPTYSHSSNDTAFIHLGN